MPGYHLPFFGALASGLFAKHGLDVEILDPPPGPDMNISHRVAAGGADFSLTGVTYHLFAHHDAGGDMPVRFVSMLQQRAGLAAMVPTSLGLTVPADLAGKRLARTRAAWLADELMQALADLGVSPLPEIVESPNGPVVALTSGAVDMTATFVDTLGFARKVGVPMHQIHLGRDIYGSGLVAADRLPPDLVLRVVHAVADAFDAQRDHPIAGVQQFCERFPSVEPDRAAQSWAELEPYAFNDQPTGSMTLSKWQGTIDWLAPVHGLRVGSVGEIVRPELILQPVGQ